MVWDGNPPFAFGGSSFIHKLLLVNLTSEMDVLQDFLFGFFLRPSLHIRICEIHHHDVGSSHAHLSSLSSFFLLDKIETFKQLYLESKTADLLTEYIQKWGQKDQLSKRSVDHKISYQKICLLKVQFTKRSEDQKISCPKDQLSIR